MNTSHHSTRSEARAAAALALLCATILGSLGCKEKTPPVTEVTPDRVTPEAPGPDTSAEPAKLPGASAPFDISGIIRKAHFSYRQEGTRFSGGHTTYGVEVTGGRITLRPWSPSPDLAARDEKRSPEQRLEHRRERSSKKPIEGAPLLLETVSISRGAVAGRPLKTAAASVDKDGSLRMARGETTELLKNSEAGIEQSWEFPRAPSGTGDLEIRVRVTGLEYTGPTDHGLHFRDPVTGLGFRYGLPAWVDSTGKRTELARASFSNGDLVLAVPASLVEASAYPARLDPVISPEFGMDYPIWSASGDQQQAKVSSGQNVYLVVWVDIQRGENRDIRGAFLTTEGGVIDEFFISDAPSDQGSPSVAWNGTDWLVVWEDYRNAATGKRVEIYGARVNFDEGGVIDAAGFPIATSNSNLLGHYQPAVACGGSGSCLVVWTEWGLGADGDIYGSLVSPVGTVGGRIPISTAPAMQCTPAVSWNGAGWLVVWTDYRAGVGSNIYGRIVKAQGQVQNSELLISTWPAQGFSAENPAVDSDSSGNWLVVWDDDYVTNAVTKFRVNGILVSGEGAILDTYYPFPEFIAGGSHPSVSWSGTNWFIVRNEGADIRGNFFRNYLNYNGEVNGVIGKGASPSVAWSALTQDWLVVWSDDRYADYDSEVYAGRVGFLPNEQSWAAGVRKDPNGIAISKRASYEFYPTVAASADNYLVVWLDYGRLDTTGVFGVRVSPAGEVLWPVIPIATSPGSKSGVAVASGGSGWLVAWAEYRNGSSDIFGKLIYVDGTVMRPGEFAISTAPGHQFRPAVAWGSTDWLVAWNDRRSGRGDIYGARVTPHGLVLGSSPSSIEIPISTASGDKDYPAVGWNGTSWLVAWEDIRNTAYSDIWGAHIEVQGATLKTTEFPISTAPWWQTKPAVAGNGGAGTSLVVWTDTRDWPGHYLYGARVLSNGSVIDPSGFAISTGYALYPSVTWTDTAWLAVWQGWSGLADTIYGRRINTDGLVLDPQEFEISNGSNPKVSSLGQRRNLVTYGHYEPSLGNYRVFGRVFNPLRNGEYCTAGSECDSGYCVFNPWNHSSYCCNTPCGRGADYCQKCTDHENGICTPTTCYDGNQCHDSLCKPSTGSCSVAVNKPNGTSCDDGKACTRNDVCTNGVCGGTTYSCPAPNQCQTGSGTCNGDGTCSYASKADGTACNDGNACTKSDVCTNGVCSGTTYACAAPGPCQNAGTCNGDGTCSGGDPVVCTALDQCHDVGICNPSTGVCSNPNKANGTSCDDGNYCTENDACQNGVCTATSQIVCTPPSQCYDFESCNDGLCYFSPKPSGAACNTGNPCIKGETCDEAGICRPPPGPLCDDGLPCTDDVCGTSGCTHSLMAGFHLCSGACALNTDPTNCGPSCKQCDSVPKGTARCDNDACGIACNSGYVWDPGTSACVPSAVLSQIRPSQGVVGATVLLSGSGFCAVPGDNVVTIGGVPAQVLEAFPDLLSATVPNVAPGPTTVTVTCNGSRSNSIAFTMVLPSNPPMITSASPASGMPGTPVVLTGSGFASNPNDDIVTFNGKLAAVSSATSSTLNVKVPPGGSTGAILMTHGITGQVSNAWDFAIFFAPTVISVNPNFAPPGTTVTINGYNFSPDSASNVVRIGGVVSPSVTAVSTQELKAVIPAGASSGTVQVNVLDIPNTASLLGLGAATPECGVSAMRAVQSGSRIPPPLRTLEWPDPLGLGSGVASNADTAITIAMAAVQPPPPDPEISGLSATVLQVGDSLTITGSNFSAIPSDNDVRFFPNVKAEITSASASSLTVKVPAGFQTGLVSVGVGKKGERSRGLPVVKGLHPYAYVGGGTSVQAGDIHDPNPSNWTLAGSAIEVGQGVRSIVMREEADYAFVAVQNSNTVRVLDLRGVPASPPILLPEKTITTPSSPQALRISPNGYKVYVVCTDHIMVIDSIPSSPDFGTKVEEVHLTGAGEPMEGASPLVDVEVSHDGNTLYVLGKSKLAYLNAANLTATAPGPITGLNSNVYRVRIAPKQISQSTLLFITRGNGGANVIGGIDIMDASTGAIIRTIDTKVTGGSATTGRDVHAPRDIAFSPTLHLAAVGMDLVTSNLGIISEPLATSATQYSSSTQTQTSQNIVWGVAFTPDSKHLLATRFDGKFLVMDYAAARGASGPNSLAIVREIGVPINTRALAVQPTKAIRITGSSPGSVSVFTPSDGIGAGPHLDVGPALGLELPSDFGSTAHNTISATLSAGAQSIFSGTLTETSNNSLVFEDQDGTVRVALAAMPSHPPGSPGTLYNVTAESTALNLAPSVFDLVETATNSNVFGTPKPSIDIRYDQPLTDTEEDRVQLQLTEPFSRVSRVFELKETGKATSEFRDSSATIIATQIASSGGSKSSRGWATWDVSSVTMEPRQVTVVETAPGSGMFSSNSRLPASDLRPSAVDASSVFIVQAIDPDATSASFDVSVASQHQLQRMDVSLSRSTDGIYRSGPFAAVVPGTTVSPPYTAFEAQPGEEFSAQFNGPDLEDRKVQERGAYLAYYYRNEDQDMADYAGEVIQPILEQVVGPYGLGYSVTKKKTLSKASAIRAAPNYGFWYSETHFGYGAGLMVDPDGKLNDVFGDDVLRPTDLPSNLAYRFVFMNACWSAFGELGPAFAAKFNAQAYLGWSVKLELRDTYRVLLPLMKSLQGRRTVAQAVAAAQLELVTNGNGDIINNLEALGHECEGTGLGISCKVVVQIK